MVDGDGGGDRDPAASENKDHDAGSALDLVKFCPFRKLVFFSI
jgi:hypothetical protein